MDLPRERGTYAMCNSKPSIISTIEAHELEIKGPFRALILSKLFRITKRKARKILDKETIDEVIYKTKKIRDRLSIELQARCGLRIGKVLKLTAQDISNWKLILQSPRSGKDEESAFMPTQIAKRLIYYATKKRVTLGERIFPIRYSSARTMVRKKWSKIAHQSSSTRSPPPFSDFCK